MDRTIADPIPGSNPSGTDLRYDVAYGEIYEALRRARGELSLHPEDSRRQSAGEDWRFVLRACREILLHRSKDLRVAAWLAEAQLAVDRLPGLRDGLEAFATLMRNFWATLYPEMEDGDDEARERVLQHVSHQLAAALRSLSERLTASRQLEAEVEACTRSLEHLISACDDTTGDGYFFFGELRAALSRWHRDLSVNLAKESAAEETCAAAEGNLTADDRLEDLLLRLVETERQKNDDPKPNELLPPPAPPIPEPPSPGVTKLLERLREVPSQESTSSASNPASPPNSEQTGLTQILKRLTEIPSPSAPASPASNVEPGEFTRAFSNPDGKFPSVSAGSTPSTPVAPSETPGSAATGNTGEFTRLFRPSPPKVDFTLTAPAQVVPRVPFEIFVWAHEPDDRARILARAREELQVRDVLARTKGTFRVPTGTALTVRLRILGAVIDEPVDAMTWEGESTCVSFVVTLPELNAQTRCGGSAHIYAEGVQIAKITFLLSGAGADGVLASSSARYRTAFASYASPDRDQVLGRIQGIRKVAPELDIFLDVLSLRSGQNWEQELWRVIPASDIFYLFWSAHARRSEWVEREWRCALRERGIGFIDPIPLESPEESPPPQELSSLHFNDWLLRR